MAGSGVIVEVVLHRAKRDWAVFWVFNLLRLAWQAEAFANLVSVIKQMMGF